MNNADFLAHLEAKLTGFWDKDDLQRIRSMSVAYQLPRKYRRTGGLRIEFRKVFIFLARKAIVDEVAKKLNPRPDPPPMDGWMKKYMDIEAYGVNEGWIRDKAAQFRRSVSETIGKPEAGAPYGRHKPK